MISSKKGFTLIEIIVAVSIFAIVMSMSLTAILGVFDANRKAKSMKTVITNLNLAIDSMSRELRYGKNYHCGTTGTLTSPQNCAGGDNFITFLNSDGTQVAYQQNGTALEKQTGSGSFLTLTSPDTLIDSLTFYTLGAGTADTLQPKVVIRIKGHASTTKERTDFTIETMASQRSPDR